MSESGASRCACSLLLLRELRKVHGEHSVRTALRRRRVLHALREEFSRGVELEHALLAERLCGGLEILCPAPHLTPVAPAARSASTKTWRQPPDDQLAANSQVHQVGVTPREQPPTPERATLRARDKRSALWGNEGTQQQGKKLRSRQV